MSDIDLSKFCGGRYAHPFSGDSFTYAVDGSILVRVARRPEVELPEPGSHYEVALHGCETYLSCAVEAWAPAAVELGPEPPPPEACGQCQGSGWMRFPKCSKCDGEGSRKCGSCEQSVDCDACDGYGVLDPVGCQPSDDGAERCDECDGAGVVEPPIVPVMLNGCPVDRRYAALLITLPGIMIEVKPEPWLNEPVQFRFDGGVGALMPLHWNSKVAKALRGEAEPVPAAQELAGAP